MERLLRVFGNREEAGRLLAVELKDLKGARPVVLALPRGGVPVAAEIARALEAPLDVVLVRKIGAPLQAELAVGAVVDGDEPELVLNEDIVSLLGVSARYIEAERRKELQEIERRRALYFGGRPRPEVSGRVVILVDDGLATGSTMRAALRATKRRGPARTIIAVPVGAPQTVAELQAEADEVRCLYMPESFGAIGLFYRDFTQISDATVEALLKEAAARVEKTLVPTSSF
jgi:putative phosphoribosyl transferase